MAHRSTSILAAPSWRDIPCVSVLTRPDGRFGGGIIPRPQPDGTLRWQFRPPAYEQGRHAGPLRFTQQAARASSRAYWAEREEAAELLARANAEAAASRPC